MNALRMSSLVVALAFAALALLPAAPAQAAPPTGTGQLALTATVVRTTVSSNAGTLTQYAMVPGEVTAPSAKVYFPRSLLALGYTDSFGFEWTADQDVQLSGTANLKIQIGCDQPVILRPQADTYRAFSFTLEVDNVAKGTFGWNPAAAVCLPGTMIAADVEIPTADTLITAGQVLRLEIGAWTSNFLGGPDTGRSMYAVVGDPAKPAALKAAGLPMAAGGGTNPAELFGLAAAQALAEAPPGSEATFSLTLANNGTESADYAIRAADLPEDFSAAFEAANGTVAAGESANVTLTVGVPADAAFGRYAFNVTVSGPNGGNATLPLTLDVTEAAPPTGDPTSSPDNTSATETDATDGTANETGNGTAAAGGDAGGIPGPPALLLGFAVSAALVLASRRPRTKT